MTLDEYLASQKRSPSDKRPVRKVEVPNGKVLVREEPEPLKASCGGKKRRVTVSTPEPEGATHFVVGTSRIAELRQENRKRKMAAEEQKAFADAKVGSERPLSADAPAFVPVSPSPNASDGEVVVETWTPPPKPLTKSQKAKRRVQKRKDAYNAGTFVPTPHTPNEKKEKSRKKQVERDATLLEIAKLQRKLACLDE